MSCSTPLRTKLGILIVLLVSGAGVFTRAGTVTQRWPATLTPLSSAELVTQLRALDAEKLPPNLQCAIQFQKVVLQIVSKAPASAWRPTLETLAKSAENENVREAARIWLAREQIKELDAVLKRYYIKHVKFPASLAELGDALPESLRLDPWGEPWAYSLRAPRGMPKLTDQRYQLGPKRFPDLMVQKRPPTPTFTRVVLSQIGDNKTLRFQTSTNDAIIQPGGTVAGATLLYIGDNWALMATQDQLFAVTFQ